MALRDTGKNINVNGVAHSVFYDKDSGAVEVQTELVKNSRGRTVGGGDAIFNSITGATEGFNQSQIEQSIVNNNIKFRGTQPGFSTNPTVNTPADGISKAIRESFQTTEKKDTYFGTAKAAQYPTDALYDKTKPDSQDHLVISQYRYKAPRANDIWGKRQPGVIVTQGIGRSSPLDQFLGLVRMPMPNALQDSNNVAWGEDRVNALEAAALNTVQPNRGDLVKSGLTGGVAALTDLAVGGSGSAGGAAMATQVGGRIAAGAASELSKSGGSLGGTILGAEGVSRILSTLGIETSAEAILARKEGVIPNSNLELLFSGPTLRQFSFVYKMSPRSSDEAKIVNQILRFFKQGMSARKQNSKGGGELAGGRSYFLGTPNVFRLQYRTTKDEAIKGLNRIKTCALTGTSVNYTPEGAFASYDGGQPVSILLSLSFQELEPIYDSDYKYEGGDGERTSDTGEGYRWKIEKDEVGY